MCACWRSCWWWYVLLGVPSSFIMLSHMPPRGMCANVCMLATCCCPPQSLPGGAFSRFLSLTLSHTHTHTHTVFPPSPNKQYSWLISVSFEISNQLNGLLSLFFTRRRRRQWCSGFSRGGATTPPPPSFQRGEKAIPQMVLWPRPSSSSLLRGGGLRPERDVAAPFNLRHAINGKIHLIPLAVRGKLGGKSVSKEGGKVWCYSNFDSFSWHCVCRASGWEEPRGVMREDASFSVERGNPGDCCRWLLPVHELMAMSVFPIQKLSCVTLDGCCYYSLAKLEWRRRCVLVGFVGVQYRERR